MSARCASLFGGKESPVLTLSQHLAEPIPTRLAAEVVVAEHYLHRRPTICFAFGIMRGWDCVGVVTFGIPASRHVQLSACASSPQSVVELNRLWVADSEPRNTESQFVASALRQLPPRVVISYADTSAGHVGYIYRALNFNYAGWTDMERKTPRFDRTPVNGTHPRSAYRIGHIGDKVERKPKVRYWITTGNRAERKQLDRMATWPKMSWADMPPPLPLSA